MYLIDAYIIDWWTLGHVALFAALGFALYRKWRMRAFIVATLAFCLGFDWELIEAHIVEPLLHFHEPFWNRWGADLLADTAGALLGRMAAKVSL